MSILFAGDVSIACGDIFSFSDFPSQVKSSPLVINLEGFVSFNPLDNLNLVYNCNSFLDSFSDFNLASISLANNHILDVKDGLSTTISFCDYHSIDTFGYMVFNNAPKISIVSNKYLLLSFGWSPIGCKTSRFLRNRVAPLEPQFVKNIVERTTKLYPSLLVVCVFHWNYEFEFYPQPLHRKLAYDLIDLGVHAIVGHHPHILGPVEIYKEKTIAYSLGNFAFSDSKFFNSQLSFPSTSHIQVC